MKTNTGEIKIVKNDASLYVNGRMQYQAVNLVAEYGSKLNGCKYAIASKHSQEKMEKRFSKSLDEFRPYIFLTGKEYAAILESQNNDSKFRMRGTNCHDPYGYTGELTEILHECEKVNADPEPNALDAIVNAIEEKEYAEKCQMMKQALASLPEVQRRRAIMFYAEGKSYREIAELENTYHSSVKKSVAAARKAIEKYFKKIS
ncbi:MAG: sigma-70 family RNA polymerase sigma factor [Mogibacterium sp.]|nr:sigma-70 family RNA polymerase sigma factor [Mogibacterium sp.]